MQYTCMYNEQPIEVIWNKITQVVVRFEKSTRANTSIMTSDLKLFQH